LAHFLQSASDHFCPLCKTADRHFTLLLDPPPSEKLQSARIASPFNFEFELEIIILFALRVFEFSHGLGQKKTPQNAQAMSASPPKATPPNR
jgi:hypothetical protein